MENTVLGNALEGVPEESEDEQPSNSNIESANNLDGKDLAETTVKSIQACLNDFLTQEWI